MLPKMKRTPLRRVSKKRTKQNRTYVNVRKEYLRENPWCEVCVKEQQLFNKAFNQGEEYTGPVKSETDPIRKSNQIHHVRKRYGELLNETRWFLAVCSICHSYIEDNKKWARDIDNPDKPKRLYLQDHLPLPIPP